MTKKTQKSCATGNPYAEEFVDDLMTINTFTAWARGCGKPLASLDAAGLFSEVETAFWILSMIAGRVAVGMSAWGQVKAAQFTQLAERAAAYAKTHPFQHPDFPDPMAELKDMILLFSLLEEAKPDGMPTSNAIAWGKRLEARSREMRIVAGMRADFAFVTKRVELEHAAQLAEAVARAEEAKAEMHRARAVAETETKAREREEKKREEAEKRAREKWVEAEEARRKEAGARARAEALAEERDRVWKLFGGKLDTIEQDARTAAREAANAAAAARGNKRDKAIDGDLVEAFRRWEVEWPKAEREGFTQIEFAGDEGFLEAVREDGLCIGTGGVSRFLKLWREWVGMGRPGVEAYHAKRRKR